LARKADAELILLHVFRGRISYKSEYLRKTAEIIAYRTHKHHNGEPAVRVSTESLSGDAATEILKYVDENKIDIITMSTHGHSGMRHWLLGSVADRVVRYSRRPVRLIKSFDNEEENTPEYDRTILVLLDGSESAEQILPYAAYHAGLSNGELILLSVCESPDVIPSISYHLIPESYPPRRPAQWERYVKEETEKREKECRLYLEQSIDKYDNKKYKVRYEYRFGNAAEEILKYLKDNPTGLIAMTTRGRSGLTLRVFGSVTEKVLSASKSPLLIMRPALKQKHRNMTLNVVLGF
jgi:nucleotide-binding universal stress UspA family protein